MGIRFDDRVAVITGAGGGLGKAYALLLASLGAKVVVNDLGGSFDGTGSDTTPAQKVVDEIKSNNGDAVANYDSVSDWEGAQNIIKTAIDSYGKIDILINNAGILRDKSMLKMELDDYRKVMSVHLDGTFFCTKAALPYMRDNNYGRIIGTSSGAGVYGNFGQTNYGPAKMGIVGLMSCVKQEGGKYNIFANTIVPVAGTRLTATIFPPDLLEKLKPEAVAPIVAWMASEECDVSGNIFSAGGGYISRAAVVEGPGVIFKESELTVDNVAAKINEIKSIEGGTEFDSVTAQTTTIMSKFSQ